MLIRGGGDPAPALRAGILILFISLLAVLPQSILQGYSEYSVPGLFSQVLNPQGYSSFALAVGVIGLLLNPVMLFALMYVLGRSLDLRATYLTVAYSLFLGALIGALLGHATIFAIPLRGSVLLTGVSMVIESVGSALSAVFVGFTAAALAFIRPRPVSDPTESQRKH